MPFFPEVSKPLLQQPEINGLDHLVLTVADINETLMFYSKVLGMKVIGFGDGRLALKFGNQKINLHCKGREYEPHANKPTPGSADLCFVTLTKLNAWIDHLNQIQVPIIDGPVERSGANGALTSIYIRDPDQNLIEIAYYN